MNFRNIYIYIIRNNISIFVLIFLIDFFEEKRKPKAFTILKVQSWGSVLKKYLKTFISNMSSSWNFEFIFEIF